MKLWRVKSASHLINQVSGTALIPVVRPLFFIDQVTRLGVPCGIISCVGNDGFGDINIHRLAADGVDIRGISVLPLEATGSAFVTYHNSGDRDFIF